MHRFYLEGLDMSRSDDIESHDHTALFSNTSTAEKFVYEFPSNRHGSFSLFCVQIYRLRLNGTRLWDLLKTGFGHFNFGPYFVEFCPCEHLPH